MMINANSQSPFELISNTPAETTNHAAVVVGAADHTTDNSEVLKHLTTSNARQTKDAATSNQLQKDKINQKKESDKEKKDGTKRILHPSIVLMLEHAWTTSKLEN